MSFESAQQPESTCSSAQREELLEKGGKVTMPVTSLWKEEYEKGAGISGQEEHSQQADPGTGRPICPLRAAGC